MVSTEEPVSKTELVGKTTIKAQLGDEIKKLSIHNDDLTYDELIIMLQRLFKKFITKDDELTIKYKDEDGDLITLNDNLDLNTALEAGSILKITVFVHGKEFCIETSEVKKIRYELQGIRDRINHLLDSLEYKKDDEIKGKSNSLEIKDKSGPIPNGPSTLDKKQLITGPSANVINKTTTSKEFDPYALLRKDRPREEVEGRTEESETFLGGASRAPPSGSSVINNLLTRPGPPSKDSQSGAVPNRGSDSSGAPKVPELDQHKQWSSTQSYPRSEIPPRPNDPSEETLDNKGAPPQIMPSVQHTRLWPPFDPLVIMDPAPPPREEDYLHKQYQAPPQWSFQANRQSPGLGAGSGPGNQQPPPPSSMPTAAAGSLKQMLPPQATPRPPLCGPPSSINQQPISQAGGPGLGSYYPPSTASYPQQPPVTSMPPPGPPKYTNEPTFKPAGGPPPPAAAPPSSSSSGMMMAQPPHPYHQGQMTQQQQQAPQQQQFTGGFNPATSSASQQHQQHYQQQHQQAPPPPFSAGGPPSSYGQQQFNPGAPPMSNPPSNPYARMPGPPPPGNSPYYQQPTSMAGPNH